MCIFHNSQPFWEQRSLTAHYKYVIWKLCNLSQNIPVFNDSFQNVRLADLRKNTYLGHWNTSTLPLHLFEYFSIPSYSHPLKANQSLKSEWVLLTNPLVSQRNQVRNGESEWKIFPYTSPILLRRQCHWNKKFPTFQNPSQKA